MTAAATIDAPTTLPPAVQDLLAARGLGDAPVRFAVPTATRVDTGGWLRGGQVWAAVVGDRFVLAATGQRPTLIQLPAAALARAVYNHVTGELGFPPVPSGTVIPAVRLDPLIARTLMSLAATSTSTSPGATSHA